MEGIMAHIVPSRVFYTSGMGRHEHELLSFELALRDAGVHMLNLVSVSSVLPPRCAFISVEEGVEEFEPGEVAFCVLSVNTSCKSGENVFSCVACAHPADESTHGYFVEYSSHEEEDDGLATAKSIASQMYKSLKGREPSRLTHVYKAGKVKRDGEYLTTVAMAVFVP